MQNNEVRNSIQQAQVWVEKDQLRALQSLLFKGALAPIGAEMEQLEDELLNLMPASTATTRKVLEHIFAAGGKRIRPAMFLLCARMLGYQGNQLLPVAAVCEFVHTASLLHDDVVDSSDLRRGRATVNSIWGNQVAVLVGDLIYSRSCELMAETGHIEIVQCFAQAIRAMSEGELLQLENVFDLQIDSEVYLEILQNKTGKLIGAACKAAGILAGASEQQIASLERFGCCVGMSFQLIDDALDYKVGSQQIGKPILADLREGKVTYPIILLRDKVSSEERSTMSGMLHQKQIHDNQIEFANKLVIAHSTVETTLQLAQDYTSEALEILRSNFPDGSIRRSIEDLVGTLLSRSF